MQIGLRQFENEVVKWFKTAAGGNDHSRYGSAKELCTPADWLSNSGKYRLTQADLALPKLAGELEISLSPVRGSRPFEGSLPAYEAFSLDAELEQLGRISVEPVKPSQHGPPDLGQHVVNRTRTCANILGNSTYQPAAPVVQSEYLFMHSLRNSPFRHLTPPWLPSPLKTAIDTKSPAKNKLH